MSGVEHRVLQSVTVCRCVSNCRLSEIFVSFLIYFALLDPEKQLSKIATLNWCLFCALDWEVPPKRRCPPTKPLDAMIHKTTN
jgi:hypothetical protein